MTHAFALLVLLADGPWHAISTEDGVQLEAQDVEGSGFERVRVTATTKASPEAVYKALWGGTAKDTTLSPEVQKREVIVDTPRERLYHDLVRPPVVSDRDFVMHQTLTGDEKAAWTAHFESVVDPRYPEKEGVVRMTKIKGALAVTPVEGGAKLVYTNLAEAGGAIPPMIVKGTARKSAVQWVKEIRRRAEEPKPK